MMKTEYMVIRVRPCPECDGTGYLINPLWQQFHAYYDALSEGKALSKGQTTEKTYTQYFEEFFQNKLGIYPDDIPDEEETCWNCNESGTIRDTVDLLDALSCVGILPKEH